MSHPYRIRRVSADVTVADDSDESTITTLLDSEVNGLLRGVIILVPSMTANQPISKTENVTVSENVSVVRV